MQPSTESTEKNRIRMYMHKLDVQKSNVKYSPEYKKKKKLTERNTKYIQPLRTTLTYTQTRRRKGIRGLGSRQPGCRFIEFFCPALGRTVLPSTSPPSLSLSLPLLFYRHYIHRTWLCSSFAGPGVYIPNDRRIYEPLGDLFRFRSLGSFGVWMCGRGRW